MGIPFSAAGRGYFPGRQPCEYDTTHLWCVVNGKPVVIALRLFVKDDLMIEELVPFCHSKPCVLAWMIPGVVVD